jgi:hypothetical protein
MPRFTATELAQTKASFIPAPRSALQMRPRWLLFAATLFHPNSMVFVACKIPTVVMSRAADQQGKVGGAEGGWGGGGTHVQAGHGGCQGEGAMWGCCQVSHPSTPGGHPCRPPRCCGATAGGSLSRRSAPVSRSTPTLSGSTSRGRSPPSHTHTPSPPCICLFPHAGARVWRCRGAPHPAMCCCCRGVCRELHSLDQDRPLSTEDFEYLALRAGFRVGLDGQLQVAGWSVCVCVCVCVFVCVCVCVCVWIDHHRALRLCHWAL